MKMETMNVHKALSELKVLDNRILSKLENFKSCTTNHHGTTKIDGILIDDWKKHVVEDYQSLNDLMNRRNAIKHALSLSNASTVLAIAGKEYTLAEAIEAKRSSMVWKNSLLNRMQDQKNRAQKDIDENIRKLPQAADTYVSALYANKDKGIDPDVLSKAREDYIKYQTLEMVDPLDMDHEMERIKDEIDNFASEVDSAISVSNATTNITIEY